MIFLPQPKSQPGKLEFIALVALQMSIIALSVDIMLPAFAEIADYFEHQDPNERQAMITLLFAGLMFGQMVFGPLSDALGRKPAMLMGLGTYLVGTLMCIFATDYSMLLLGRFLQGFGGAGPRIIIVAMVRDRYEGKAMAEIMSFALTVFIMIPTFAPAVGQLVLFFAPWQAVFVALLVVAVFGATWFTFRQPETHTNPKPFNASLLFTAVKETVTTPVSLFYALASGCALGTLLGYVVSSQQILQDIYGTGDLFALYFGIAAACIAAGTLVNTRLLRVMSMEQINAMAIAGLIVWTSGFLVWLLVGPGQMSLTAFMVFTCVTLFLVGQTFGNFNAIALRPLGHIAGIAASVTASLQTLVSATAAALIGGAFNMTVLPMVAGALIMALLCLGLMGSATIIRNRAQRAEISTGS